MLLPLSTCFISLSAYWLFIYLYPTDEDDADIILKDNSIHDTQSSNTSSSTTSAIYDRTTIHSYQSINSNHASDNNNIDTIDTIDNDTNNIESNNNSINHKYETYQNANHNHISDYPGTTMNYSEKSLLNSIDPEDVPIEYESVTHK